MEAALGNAIDQGADAVIESMGKMMTATMQKPSAEVELRGKLASIMEQAMTK